MQKSKKLTVVMIICIILMCIGYSAKQMPNDTFYTVKIGQYITENGFKNMHDDPFSWHELPYTFPHWLYDFGIFQVYNAFGWTGIYISTIVLSSVLGLLIYKHCMKRTDNPIISGFFTMAMIMLLNIFLCARAQLVSFSIIVLQIMFIEDLLETGKKRFGIYLLILSLLLVNIHTAVWPFSFVLYLPYFAEEICFKIFNYFHKKKNKDDNSKGEYYLYKIKICSNKNIKKLLIVFLLSMCIGIVNPVSPTNAYTYLFKSLDSNMMNLILEHQPPTDILIYSYGLITFGLLFVMYFSDINIEARSVFFYVGLLVIYFKSFRQLSMFTIVLTPIYAENINILINEYVPKFNTFLYRLLNMIYTPILFILMILLLSYNTLRPKLALDYIDSKTYPVEASQWIKDNLDYKNIRIINEYEFGSYMLYQDIPVFIDTRCDLYCPSYNTKTGNKKDGIDLLSESVTFLAKGINTYEICKKYRATHIIVSSDYTMLLKSIEEDEKNFKKIYPLEEKDIEQNNIFSIYEIVY